MRFVLLVSLVVGCTFGRADPPPPAVLDTVPVVSEPLEGVVVEPRPGTCDFRGGTITEESTRCEVETTRFYVVSQVLYPEVSLVGGVERTAGLDLDGMETTGDSFDSGCGVPDFTSLDGAFGGIDNQGAALGPTFDAILDSGGLDATARTAIAEGRFGAVIEIRNWNETAEDTCVDVFVYEATIEEPVLDTFGRLTRDQIVVLSSGPRRYGYGHVRSGELRTGLGGFPVPQPFMADLHNAHLRLQLTDARAAGLVVGELPVDTGAASIACRSEDDALAALVRSTAESVADLRPDADGVCTSLSWGVNIEAVRAVVE